MLSPGHSDAVECDEVDGSYEMPSTSGHPLRVKAEEESNESANAPMQDEPTLSLPPPTSQPTSPIASVVSPSDFFLSALKESGLDLIDSIRRSERALAQQRGQTDDHTYATSLSSYCLTYSSSSLVWLKFRLEQRAAKWSREEQNKFLQGLEQICSRDSSGEGDGNTSMLLHLLVPTIPPPSSIGGFAMSQRASSHANNGNGGSASASSSSVVAYTQQDSIIRVLLLIESLQMGIVKMLLRLIETIAHDPHYGSRSSSTQPGGSTVASSPLPNLILTQLRYLDQVYNGAAMSELLKETVQRILDPDILVPVIQAIPDVINANEHKVKNARHSSEVVAIKCTMCFIQLSKIFLPRFFFLLVDNGSLLDSTLLRE